MSKQSEALRLAEQLEAIGLRGPVAAELRRLHAENAILHERHHDDNAEYMRVLAQRDQLLEALNSFMYEFGDKTDSATVQKARAAIAKAKEQQ